LESLGYRIVLPAQNCCGLPLQSNGLFQAARSYARSNLENLEPYIKAGIPILGSSTSCTLELKHEYQTVLGMRGNGFQELAQSVMDLFEFLLMHAYGPLEEAGFTEVPLRILYHAPCQLKSHWIGTPALEVLRRIPGLEIISSQSECCGVAGTYGVKSEKYAVARDVGLRLFQQAQAQSVDLVVTDSETCRWWIRHHTGKACAHPAEVLAISLGLRERVLEYLPFSDK
jgi:glycerol-3-phosphate dehydrogenase subunit C